MGGVFLWSLTYPDRYSGEGFSIPSLLHTRNATDSASNWGLSSNGTEMYAKGVDRYLPEMGLRRIQE